MTQYTVEFNITRTYTMDCEADNKEQAVKNFWDEVNNNDDNSMDKWLEQSCSKQEIDAEDWSDAHVCAETYYFVNDGLDKDYFDTEEEAEEHSNYINKKENRSVMMEAYSGFGHIYFDEEGNAVDGYESGGDDEYDLDGWAY